MLTFRTLDGYRTDSRIVTTPRYRSGDADTVSVTSPCVGSPGVQLAAESGLVAEDWLGYGGGASGYIGRRLTRQP